MELSLSLLGEFAVCLDKKPIKNLNAEKAHALLFFLAVESDRAHRRDALAEMLWPEKPAGFGRNNLKQALSLLRTALGDREAEEPFLLTSNRDLQFNSGSTYDVDVLIFEELIAEVNSHPHPSAESCISCAGVLHQAAELYRSDFLDNFYLTDSSEFHEWTLSKRETYRRKMAEVLKKLIKFHLDQENIQLAARYGKDLVNLEPWSENNRRRLMNLLVSSGRRTAALKEYHACEAMLKNEFNVKPATETRALYKEIKAWNFDKDQKIKKRLPVDEDKEIQATDRTTQDSSLLLKCWVKISAAISFLVLIGIIYTIFFKNESEPQPVPLLAVNDSTLSNIDMGTAFPMVIPPDENSISENSPDSDSPGVLATTTVLGGISADALPIAENCLPGESLIYQEDFQDSQAQDWPEIYYQAQGWQLIPDPSSPGNIVLHHTGKQDATAILQQIIFENAAWRFWMMESGSGRAFLLWNWTSSPFANEIEFSSYQMDINFRKGNLSENSIYRVEWPISHIGIVDKQIQSENNSWALYEIINYQDQIEIWVDHKLIIAYQDPFPLPTGNVGFEVWKTDDKDFQIYFDNISICGLAPNFQSQILKDQ